MTRESLIAKGLLSGINKRLPIKILTKGDFDKVLTFVNIEKFSKTAKDFVEKAGGSIELRETKESK